MYTLKNEFMEVEIINYGGVLRKISTPNKEGVLENVVLNLPSIKDYEEDLLTLVLLQVEMLEELVMELFIKWRNLYIN